MNRKGARGKGKVLGVLAYLSTRGKVLSALAMLGFLVAAGSVLEATWPTRLSRVFDLFSSPAIAGGTWIGPDVIGSLPRDPSGQIRIEVPEGIKDRPVPAAIKQRLGELEAQRDRVYGSLRRGAFPTDPPDLPESELALPTDLSDFHPGIDP